MQITQLRDSSIAEITFSTPRKQSTFSSGLARTTFPLTFARISVDDLHGKSPTASVVIVFIEERKLVPSIFLEIARNIVANND